MSLKILGGTLKGIDIKSAPSKHKNSEKTRPTSVILRRKFFDAHQDLSHWNFIDLCAGTGTMAFEALSRGASSIICNDLSKYNISLLKENTATILKLLPEAKIQISQESFEKLLNANHSLQTIFYFDPPYEKLELYSQFAHWFKTTDLVGHKVVVEFCRQKTMPLSEIENLFGVAERIYQQGTSFLTVYDL